MVFCDFGWALEKLRAGLAVARKGWNGKGLAVFMQRRDEHSKMTKDYLYIRTVQGDLIPWTITQSDALADDWSVVK